VPVDWLRGIRVSFARAFKGAGQRTAVGRRGELGGGAASARGTWRASGALIYGGLPHSLYDR
jgi:hypothetical protein